MRAFVSLCFVLLASFACAAEEAPIAIEPPQLDRPVDFARDVLPIFRAHCSACHNDQKAENGLSLESPEKILTGGDSGPAVVAKKSDESLLLLASSRREKPHMPPQENRAGAKPLSPRQLGILKLWIDQGAGGSAPARQIEWKSPAASYQPIFATAVTSDGQYVAASRGNRLHVYHGPSGKLVATLVDPALGTAAHHDVIRSLAFDPAGGRLASGAFREVKLWRVPRVMKLSEQAAAANFTAAATNGKLVALGDESGQVTLWEVSSGKPLVNFAASSKPISALALSADGALLVASDKSLAGFKADGSALHPAVETASPISTLVSFAGGEQLVTTHADGVARVWSATEPFDKPLREIKVSDQPLTTLAVAAPDAKEFYTGGADGVVRKYGAENDQPARELRLGAPVTSLAVSGDRIAAVGGLRIKLWNAASGEDVTEIVADPRLIAAAAKVESELAFAKTAVDHAKNDIKSYEGTERRVMTTAEAIKKAEEEQAKTNKTRDEKQAALEKAKAENKDPKAIENAEKAAAEAETAAQVAVTIIDRAKAVAAKAVADFEAAKQDLAAREAKQKELEQALAAANKAKSDSPAKFARVALSGDGRRLLTATEDGALVSYRAEDAARQETIVAHTSGVTVLASGHGAHLVSAAGKHAALWSAGSDWTLERTIGGAEQTLADRVLALDFHPGGELLATGGGVPARSGEVKLWRVADGTLAKELPAAHADTVFAVRFSLDGARLATAGADRLIKISDVESGAARHTLAGHTAHVLALAWHGEGKLLASGGADRTLKLWDAEKGLPGVTMKGTTYQIGPYRGEVAAVAFIGASEQMLAACGDGTVRLHRTTSENDIMTYGGSKSYQYSAAAAADGRVLVAGGADGVLRIWTGLERSPQRELPPVDATP